MYLLLSNQHLQCSRLALLQLKFAFILMKTLKEGVKHNICGLFLEEEIRTQWPTAMLIGLEQQAVDIRYSHV